MAKGKRERGGSSSSKGGFDPDYRYVLQDLKRILLIAGGLVISLVVLSFFIN